jgi:hypothetical protein
MNRFIFLLLSFFVYTVVSRADYLNTATSNQCVYNVVPYQDNTGWCYTKREDDRTYCNKNLNLDDLIDGYYLDGEDCLLKKDLKITGLTENQLNYQMYLMGNFVGFSSLIIMLFLVVLSTRK